MACGTRRLIGRYARNSGGGAAGSRPRPPRHRLARPAYQGPPDGDALDAGGAVVGVIDGFAVADVVGITDVVGVGAMVGVADMVGVEDMPGLGATGAVWWLRAHSRPSVFPAASV